MALPALTPVTRPVVLTVATPRTLEVQVAVALMSWVLASVKVPVAINWRVPPTRTVKLEGVTAMETRVGAMIVAAEAPLLPPCVAVMVAVPTPAPVTSPVVLAVTTPEALVVQVAVAVRFAVLRSL